MSLLSCVSVLKLPEGPSGKVGLPGWEQPLLPNGGIIIILTISSYFFEIEFYVAQASFELAT